MEISKLLVKLIHVLQHISGDVAQKVASQSEKLWARCMFWSALFLSSTERCSLFWLKSKHAMHSQQHTLSNTKNNNNRFHHVVAPFHNSREGSQFSWAEKKCGSKQTASPQFLRLRRHFLSDIPRNVLQNLYQFYQQFGHLHLNSKYPHFNF